MGYTSGIEGERIKAAMSEALGCHRMPLIGVSEKVSNCVVMPWSEKEGECVRILYRLSGIAKLRMQSDVSWEEESEVDGMAAGRKGKRRPERIRKS